MPAEPDETTHFSVIDRDGMAVTNTYTLEGGYGSHVVVKGAGFLLNNEMGDFNKKPGETNTDRRHRHAGEPDRSGQADAQLDDADDGAQGRQGRAVTGSPGGRTIINTVFTIVLGIVEYGLNGRQAVDLARMHHQWLPDKVTIEKDADHRRTVLEKLEAMGHDDLGRRTPGRRALDLGRAGRHRFTAFRTSGPRTERRRCRRV